MTENNWLHHPEVFINSAGFGICDDRASVLAALWKAMGFEVRIWNLNGQHVVPEVNDGSGWKVFDPAEGYFFTTEENKVASYDDIISGCPLSYQSYHPKKTITRLLENAACSQKYINAYASDIRLLYGNGKNNTDVTRQFSIPDSPHEEIVLPRLSELSFLHSKYLFTERKVPINGIVKITLSPDAKGKLYLPLIPLGCVGNFRFEKSGKQFSVSGDFVFDNNDNPITSLIINEVKEVSVIYFLANGIKYAGDYMNSDKIESSFTDLMRITKPVENKDQLETLLHTQELSDDLFSKLAGFTCYLDSLNPVITSYEDFGKIYNDFNKRVYNRQTAEDRYSFKDFMNDYLTDEPAGNPFPSTVENWNTVTVLCYAMSICQP
ncbi:MAG TPA: hypothetical protein VNJ07_13765 [Chitinophagales bacterium]|nr:hypothetical protein [Chitinophagales bacterium]